MTFSCTPVPRFSKHAELRWGERCADLDRDQEWATGRRPGASIRRQIREGCPGHAALLAGRKYRGFWYVVSRHRVVFVVANATAEDIVVTVWRLPHGSRV